MIEAGSILSVERGGWLVIVIVCIKGNLKGGMRALRIRMTFFTDSIEYMVFIVCYKWNTTGRDMKSDICG